MNTKKKNQNFKSETQKNDLVRNFNQDVQELISNIYFVINNVIYFEKLILAVIFIITVLF